MERYKVTLAPHGEAEDIRLLIPFHSTATVSDFATEVKRRASRLNIWQDIEDVVFHLGPANGPILDYDDSLCDLLVDPLTEIITATFRARATGGVKPGSSLVPQVPQARSLGSEVHEGIKIRVVTPTLARPQNDLSAIPLLRNGSTFSDSTTLRDIKVQIATHLGYSVESDGQGHDEKECNCSFARKIDERGTWDKLDCECHGPSRVLSHPANMCSFSYQNREIPLSQACALCSKPLSDHQQDQDITSDPSATCFSSILLRTDAYCGHVIHSSCAASSAPPWTCPPRCRSESAPISAPVIRHQRLVVVYDKCKVVSIETSATERSSILCIVQEKFGEDIEQEKRVDFVGGFQTSPGFYLKLPVISICSKERHAAGPSRSRAPPRGGSDIDSDDLDGDVALTENAPRTGYRKVLDLHTGEIPIETANLDLTIDQLGLKDCAVNGVLTIYALERRVSVAYKERRSGKDAIFRISDFWEHPVAQSERGMAMFLSSLRAFTDLISARRMQEPSQDAVLHLLHLLTNFPPAVRTVHILMNNKTPRPSECAALGQAVYEILKDLVPSQLIRADMGRIFEGTRLFFGLILEKAKHLKLPGDVRLPYLSCFNVLDLKCYETTETIINPVQTSAGLLEEGFYNAARYGGILNWGSGEQSLSTKPLSARTKRVALLSGGIVPEVTIFDLDSLGSSPSYPDGGTVENVITRLEMSDLLHLSVLCGRNRLSVIAPASLASSEAPALTLDRNGLLAVYTGRAPCAEPGKDFIMFRPTRGGDETVDVAIITQLLAPILEQREADGTSVFDLFGGPNKRKSGAPDEILMFCLDCSVSMSRATDFEEIREDENTNREVVSASSNQASIEEDGTFSLATLDEMKELLCQHESWDDMQSIVQDALPYYRRQMALKVLEILNSIASQELNHWLERLESLRQSTTWGFARRASSSYDSRISNLKTFVTGLGTHKQAICDFLIFRAENSGELEEHWKWLVGDAIPKIPKTFPSAPTLSEGEFSIPNEFRCPISQELFKDPVIASDGMTYERNAIQRWFQIRNSSPLTGLELQNTSLRHNGLLSSRVRGWVRGEDILEQPAAKPPKRARTTRSSDKFLNLELFSRLGSFERRAPASLSVKDLYKIAFRGLEGRYSQFGLHFGNMHLVPSDDQIASTNLTNGSRIHINIHEANPGNPSPSVNHASANTEFEEMCLIKVYWDHDDVLFSYWVPKKVNKTLASITFRYWRHTLKSNPYAAKRDIQVWTDMRYWGDETCRGYPQDHWEELSMFLTSSRATGTLTEESVYSKQDKEDDGDLYSSADDAIGASAFGPGHKPLVLKVLLGGQKKKGNGGKNLSRLDVLKQMFDAFINRILAYNYETHVGLITFDTTAKVSQALTHVVENFRHRVNSMEANGDTAIWDALALANDQITEYAQRFPKAMKRIICLSDGNDTKSLRRPRDICWTLMQNKVVVDSFCLGDEDNEDLRTISYLSGGYKFVPKSLEQAMAICEMEPVLSQLERPPVVLPPEATRVRSASLPFIKAVHKATPEIVTRDVFPKRKEHPNLHDRFVELSSLARATSSSVVGSNAAASSIAPQSKSYLRTPRLLSEMKNVVANPHPYYDVYVSESNMAFWKVVMQGPPQSAYADGTFVLYLDMEDNYPLLPPKGRFHTPIYHPNINRHGRICHSIFDRNWTSDTTNSQVLNTVFSLLLVPEFSDPINTVVTLDFHWDEVAFQDEVKEHIRKHATKTRATWKTELLGEEVEEDV